MHEVIFYVLTLFYYLWTYFVIYDFSRIIKTCVHFFSIYENYFIIYVYM
jgi:hypothetical protein